MDASSFGFSPTATGIENAAALQKAVDIGGTVTDSAPGIFKTASTVYLRSDTRLVFGSGVFLKKVDEQGPFAQVLINNGALTKTYDENITVEGLHIVVNQIDNCSEPAQKFPYRKMWSWTTSK